MSVVQLRESPIDQGTDTIKWEKSVGQFILHQLYHYGLLDDSKIDPDGWKSVTVVWDCLVVMASPEKKQDDAEWKRNFQLPTGRSKTAMTQSLLFVTSPTSVS